MNKAWHMYDRAILFLILGVASHDAYAKYLWYVLFLVHAAFSMYQEYKDKGEVVEQVTEEVLGTGLGKQDDYGCWVMGDEEVDLWPISGKQGTLIFRRTK